MGKLTDFFKATHSQALDKLTPLCLDCLKFALAITSILVYFDAQNESSTNI